MNECLRERAAERTNTRSRAWEDPGWMAENITGFVTVVSHNTNGHWITVERNPDAYCGKSSKRRRTRCARWGLGISSETAVLRGEGDDARPASPSDIEEGQRVHAFPGDDIAPAYPPAAVADKVVILAPR